MAFNGSGVFNRLYNWVNDKNAGIKINSTRMDAEMNGMAVGLTTCITRDGQTTITADLPMAGFKHTGVGDAAAGDEYVALGQLQDNGFNYAATVGGTGNAIELTLAPAITAYAAGQMFSFIATADNTTATTIDINGVGADSIFQNGAALVGGEIIAGNPYLIFYDGTQFNLISVSAGLLNFQDYTLQRPTIKDYALAANGNYPNISGSVTINIAATGNIHTGTLTGNVTYAFSNPSPSGAACAILVLVKQDGTGSHTITWPTLVGGAPTAPTAGAGKYSAYQFVTLDAGSNWFFVGERLGS